jgi:hypothetical protein
VNDQFSHTHGTTDKIIIQYFSILKFLDNKLETKDFAPNSSKHSLT